MGRGTAGERGVAEGLWEGNWDRQGNGQHEGHLGVFNIFFFFTKMQLYHGIQTSLFFLDKVLIHTGLTPGQ